MNVALRKESVDRNMQREIMQREIVKVALRKESVDRNARKIRYVAPDVSSLSARRAWIEICPGRIWSTAFAGRSPQGERG